jgi:hypothetical protein
VQGLGERRFTDLVIPRLYADDIIPALQATKGIAVEKLREEIDGEVIEIVPNVDVIARCRILINLGNQDGNFLCNNGLWIRDGLLGKNMGKHPPLGLVLGFGSCIS